MIEAFFFLAAIFFLRRACRACRARPAPPIVVHVHQYFYPPPGPGEPVLLLDDEVPDMPRSASNVVRLRRRDAA